MSYLLLIITNSGANRFFFSFKDKEDAENSNLIIYIQQAAAAKSIGILARLSIQIAEQFLSVSKKINY